MKNSVYYRQCKMEEVNNDGKTIIYTAWIPERMAIVGKIVEIDHSKDRSQSYTIKSVSINRMMRDEIHDVHNLKQHFPSIDR